MSIYNGNNFYNQLSEDILKNCKIKNIEENYYQMFIHHSLKDF